MASQRLTRTPIWIFATITGIVAGIVTGVVLYTRHNVSAQVLPLAMAAQPPTVPVTPVERSVEVQLPTIDLPKGEKFITAIPGRNQPIIYTFAGYNYIITEKRPEGEKPRRLTIFAGFKVVPELYIQEH
jgi:hypothetical protein